MEFSVFKNFAFRVSEVGANGTESKEKEIYDLQGRRLNRITKAGIYIVDGKQRLNALIRFVCDKFKDLHGNYFSDLSDWAKNEFLDSMVLSYAELGETATDKDVIETFLGVNHTGTPMAKEHIESVKSIQDKLK